MKRKMGFFSDITRGVSSIAGSVRNIANDTINHVAKPIYNGIKDKVVNPAIDKVGKPLVEKILKPAIDKAIIPVAEKAIDFVDNRIDNIDNVLTASSQGLAFLGKNPLLTIGVGIAGLVVLSSVLGRK